MKEDVADWVAQGHLSRGWRPCWSATTPAPPSTSATSRRPPPRSGSRASTTGCPQDASHEEVEALIRQLAAASRVSGILLQLPTPRQVDGQALTALIPPGKDVDGLTPVSAGLLAQGRPGLRPCTPLGVMELLRRHEVPLQGAEAVVVGRSDLVGRPLAALLLARQRHRDRLPLAHPRPRRGLPPRRRARRRRRAPADDPGRLGQAGRDGDRRRDQPHRRRARRRRRLRVRRRARRADHARPGRRRADDDRDAAAQHAAGGQARRGRRRVRSGAEPAAAAMWSPACGGVALLVTLFLAWYSAGGSASFGGREIQVSLSSTPGRRSASPT